MNSTIGIGEASTSAPNTSTWSHLQDEDDDLFLVNEDLNLNTSKLRSDEKYVGFDNNVGDTWIYPSNFPERAYQYNIVQKALFHNTLVVLPTGLGKTFIAAVVMYNMYRWYPMGKVIFMAPTRPLVTQQIDACCKIVGIPKSDSVEITGKLNKASRALLWRSKRVFFATPQSVQSDILDTELDFPFQAVKLVVVDEAHRAKGRYAYTDVISSIWKKNKYFRILALSATPGRRKDDVEEVIRNLFISNLEVRTEDSVDVVSYVHKRQIKTVVVKLGQKLEGIRNELLAIADPHIRNLIENRLISGRPGSISRNWLVMEQKKFRESLINNRTPFQKELSSDFSICISVYHAIELLERHGLRVFLNNFDETQEGGTKFVVILRPDLRRLIERIREEIGPNPFAVSDQCMVNGEIAPIPTNIDFGHPKFELVRDHVVAHFEQHKDTRVIIFCEYRESVMLMHRLLLQHRPLIRPRVFVGKGGTGSIRAVTQQQQMKVMTDFRSGVSNALIATSVAEEGIDVGEVDLIVCFDINTSNPTRFIQRIGRTGRKKQGKVVLLATEGKEYSMLKDVLSERSRLNKSISRGGEFASAFYKQAPRMVPTEFNPKCMKTFVQPLQSPEPKLKIQKTAQPTTKGNRNTKSIQKHDLRHFFKQKVTLDDEEKCVFENTEAANNIKSNEPTTEKDTFFDENELIIKFSPPKLIEVSNKTVRRITKYVRASSRGLTLDVKKAITSKKLCKDSLQFLIDFSPDLMQNVWSHMQDLWKRGIHENTLPTKGITSEEKQAVRVYFQLMSIFGTKDNIAANVAKKQESPIAFNFSNLKSKYKSVFEGLPQNDIYHDNVEYLMNRFEKISDLFSSKKCINSSFIHSMVYDDELDEMDNSNSRFNESSRDYSNDCIVDSKYMSQWEELPQNSSKNNNFEPSPSTSFSKPAIKPLECEHNDDVFFVGESQQQSTPIRQNSFKQLLLNFDQTPIAKRIKKSTTEQRLPQRQSCSKIENKIVYPRESPKKSRSETSEKKSLESYENHEDFFDDQFDAIIVANSRIIDNIESNKEKIHQLDCSANVGTRQTNSNSRARYCPASSSLNLELNFGVSASNDSTSDDVILVSSSPKTRSPLQTNDFSQKEIVVSQLDLNKTRLGSEYDFNHDKNEISFSKPKEITGDIASKRSSFNGNLSSMIHPELLDIDFNIFSEAFSDETTDSLQPQLISNDKMSPQRASPDIFEELAECSSNQQVAEISPVKRITSPQPEVSPCVLTKKTLTWRQVRQKYVRPNLESTPPVPSQADDSAIHVPSKIRPKRRIIDSDSESSDGGDNLVVNKRTEPDFRKVIRENAFKKARLTRKRANEFVDDEAVLSGSATEDELEHTVGYYMADSVVVHDDEAENDAVNMTQVYLRSVRSPSGHLRGAFKIPAPRIYNDASMIFSQRNLENNSTFVNDSFVVSDEGSDADQTMCPLERAEEILKAERRAKRKAKIINGNKFKQPAKKKKVLRIHNSSDESDDFA